MTTGTRKESMLEKLETGIPGFDLLAHGGLPRLRTTLVSGTSGSAKTVFGTQFLATGIERGEPGVFVTFEEPPSEIRRNVLGFGWDIESWERENQWAFVDASPDMLEVVVAGTFDFGALLARIEYAVKKVGAKRLTIDSVGAIFTQFNDSSMVRAELFRIIRALKDLGVTSVLTAERTEEYGEIARYGVEEFVADNVAILRNVLEGERRRRTVEILKFRGTSHHKGEFPFTIVSGKGIIMISTSAMELTQQSSTTRVSSGIVELDRMCNGGFFRDSIILVSGATGTGKTLSVAHFMTVDGAPDERSLLFAFEESQEQLVRNASGWGLDFATMVDARRLRIDCSYPEAVGLEDHLIAIKTAVDEFQPTRVAVDSLSALERVSTERSYREFVIALTSFIKERQIVGLFTATTPTLMGGASVTEEHISTLTDSIVLLRYIEMFGEMQRAITVLKMRGSNHDKEIRQILIDGDGMHIGKSFRGVTGILAGAPTYSMPGEAERLGEMFAGEGEE